MRTLRSLILETQKPFSREWLSSTARLLQSSIYAWPIVKTAQRGITDGDLAKVLKISGDIKDLKTRVVYHIHIFHSIVTMDGTPDEEKEGIHAYLKMNTTKIGEYTKYMDIPRGNIDELLKEMKLCLYKAIENMFVENGPELVDVFLKPSKEIQAAALEVDPKSIKYIKDLHPELKNRYGHLYDIIDAGII